MVLRVGSVEIHILNLKYGSRYGGKDQSEGSVSSTVTKARVNDKSSACEDYTIKVRKPYTVTKQREKWTDEEHTKFLEALRLYGRAWPQIKKHVGNKTAVQIRSHAQKFFSKVVRDENGIDGAVVEPIEIPPPRAKRKPTRPYPRNRSVPLKKGADLTRSTSPYSLGLNQENETPTSPKSVCTQSLKLFGKTVFVSDSTITTLPCNSMSTLALDCPPTPSLSVYGDLAYHFLQSSDPIDLTTQSLLACESEDGGFGKKVDKYAKGFVRYKRCLAEKSIHSFMSTGEEREDLRVRLCL